MTAHLLEVRRVSKTFAGGTIALQATDLSVRENDFITILGPSGVRIDSGWNCTPKRGRPRWRIPMTRASSVHAITSSSGGNEPREVNG